MFCALFNDGLSSQQSMEYQMLGRYWMVDWERGVKTGRGIFEGIYLIYLLTAIGLKLGGSSTVHIYTKIMHRTT